MSEWRTAISHAVNEWGTPVYVFRASEICRSLGLLTNLRSPIPVRHWLSCKTLVLSPLLDLWRASGGCVEVVSPFELLAALQCGFEGHQILINGTAKHRWLYNCTVKNLGVQIDSLVEAEALLESSRKYEWNLGIRFHTTANRDPDNRSHADHFGVHSTKVGKIFSLFKRHNIPLNCASFHLHSNLDNYHSYLTALEQVASLCNRFSVHPEFVDIGGGLPATGEDLVGNREGLPFDIKSLEGVYNSAHAFFPSARELWQENGRFISSAAGRLAVRVWDIKKHGRARYLICDGGRVNCALPSDWQRHQLSILPERNGRLTKTTVCGPTCMAYDVLARTQLPNDIEPGDIIVWHNAGAYHLAWETRFSFGYSPIVWFDENEKPTLIRPRESFKDWFGVA